MSPFATDRMVHEKLIYIPESCHLGTELIMARERGKMIPIESGGRKEAESVRRESKLNVTRFPCGPDQMKNKDLNLRPRGRGKEISQFIIAHKQRHDGRLSVLSPPPLSTMFTPKRSELGRLQPTITPQRGRKRD